LAGAAIFLMKYKAVLFLSVFWILIGSQSKAFNPLDTNHAVKPHNITTATTEPAITPFHQWQKAPWIVDTTLDNLQYYLPQYNLGNSGSPYVPVIFNSGLRPLGFYYGDNYLGSQLFSDSTIRYYNTRAPYVRFYYVTDPQIHQYINFIYAQNIGKQFNFTLEFQRTRSDGTYLNQNTNVNQLTLAVNYHTKHYMIFANGMFGVYKLNQNGGISNDTDIGSSILTNRQTVPINLAAARSTYRDNSIHVKQYFFFDYNSGDSSHPGTPLLYVAHSLRLGSSSNVFSDPGPLNFAYYDKFFYPRDTSGTYDSLHYNEVSNDVSIGSAKRWGNNLKWEAGITDQFVHFTDTRTDSIFVNYIAHACVYDTGRVLYNIKASEIFAGNQAGDMQVSGCLGFLIDSLHSVRVQGDYSSQTPTLLSQLYYGNNIAWRNYFNNVNTSSVSLIYQDIKWKLSMILQATQIQNYVYYDSYALPEQYSKSISVLSAHVRKEFTLGKWHLNTDDIVQYVPDSLPLRLPLFVLENSVFYQNYLFHKALLLRIGVDVYYNTSYYGYAYIPISGQYYIQNQEKLGNYPYVDPFVSFRIKQFRMFVRLENGGSGILGHNYLYALNYPMPDRVLRFGISWDFWN